MAQITVMLFGPLAEITGSPQLVLNNVSDTEALLAEMQTRYPALQHTTFVLAVNKQIALQSTALPEGSTVALLPPFSGG